DEDEDRTKKEKEPNSKKEDKPKLGLQIEDLKNYPGLREKLEISSGVVVTNVTEESPAEKAGFEKGDIIVEVDKQKVGNASDFKNSISKFKKGNSYLFKVLRERELKLIVIEVP
ncbi:MAG: PDZ domain-containing protein, partial [Deltaproteobacteria bacterium]|nr:PDZ domain-containing protein [Deltaproteobacteria bacterium]